MVRIMLAAFIFSSMLLLTGFFGGPELKAVSEETYKESLKKIFDAEPSEEKRIEIGSAILSVLSEGKDADLGKDSSKAYQLYRASQMFGGGGRLMVLDGKTPAEIIEAGEAARKQWKLENLPKQIEDYKKQIIDLEEQKKKAAEGKRLEAEAERTKKAASIADVTVKPEKDEALSKKFVDHFLVGFTAVNDGSVGIYEYRLRVELFDSTRTDGKRIAGTGWGGGYETTVEFKEPVPAGGRSNGVLKVSARTHQLPYAENRYTVKASLVKVETKKPGAFSMGTPSFSEYDEKSLTTAREKLVATEAELQKYK